MFVLEMQRKEQEQKMLKQLENDRKKHKYYQQQKERVAEFQ